jgi:hypothetical protein
MIRHSNFHISRAFRLLIIFLLGWCCSFGAGLVYAADIRILLDVSQSMAQHDPENHRRDALNQLIDAIPAGDKAAVWTFGQYVNLLVPHERVDRAWRRRARAEIQDLGAPAIRTNIGGVLQEAAYDFQFSGLNEQVEIILITDGEVDIAPNSEVNAVERSRVLKQLVPLYQRANAKINTVALSDDADHDLLMQLSEETGGSYYRVGDPSLFVDAVLDLSSSVALSKPVAVADATTTAESSINDAHHFYVEPDVEELTITISHAAAAAVLVSPSGQETSAIAPMTQRWQVLPGMSQVTIDRPETGQWSLKGVQATEIQQYADIALNWIKPEQSSVPEGSSVILEASLKDSRGRSILGTLQDHLAVRMSVDGINVPVRILEDVIQASLPGLQAMDIREVALEVNGTTFSRQLTRQLHSIVPYISEVLVLEDAYEWRLYTNRFLDIEGVKALALYDQEGRIMSEPFVQHDGGYWYWRLPFDKPNGQYQVKLNGELMQLEGLIPLTTETKDFQLPPVVSAGMVRTPSIPMASQAAMAGGMTTDSGFMKEPMPVFEELQPELTVDQSSSLTQTGGMDDVKTQTIPVSEPVSWLTYMLLSLAGILVLATGYLAYRWFENRRELKSAETDLLIGDDELADIGASGQDPDLDLGMPESEVASAALDLSESELPSDDEIDAIIQRTDMSAPPPEQTEAPSPAVEDMLEEAEANTTAETEETETVNEEEELFDISSIDDDLADLDLALDGDDPFADVEKNKQ